MEDQQRFFLEIPDKDIFLFPMMDSVGVGSDEVTFLWYQVFRSATIVDQFVWVPRNQRRQPESRALVLDFSIPSQLSADVLGFKDFLKTRLEPHLPDWYREGSMPRSFHAAVAKNGWSGFEYKEARLVKHSALREALLGEQLAALSPGVAVAILAHIDLGIMGLWLFGSRTLIKRYGELVASAETLMCLGNTESVAGSDVAGITTNAVKVDGGWVLNGTKAYVTNGLVSDLAVITAVSDPDASRNRRLSMFLVDLHSEGVHLRKLNKRVWIPSDLTRIEFTDVFVPNEHLLGERGRGLQQVLTIFTHSRVPISALTLGTASGAFELALQRAKKREIFGKKILEFQSKAFEIADFYARMEAARLALWKACWTMDQGEDFRLESSVAKYLAVMIAREVTTWAADLFGAASVMFEHPIHRFPLDAWASSLGEGTQDVQKLVIFREILRRYTDSRTCEV